VIAKLQVMGNSKLIIDWVKGKNKIENPMLCPTMDRISEVRNKFLDSFIFTGN